MTYDKTCGDVRLSVSPPSPCRARIEHIGAQLSGMSLEDLRDLRYLIDAALRAAK